MTFKMAVKGLPKGQRGFHVHENGDCGPAMKDGKMTAGVAAGEHYDPDGAKSHKGPKGGGHRGDLPALRQRPKASTRPSPPPTSSFPTSPGARSSSTRAATPIPISPRTGAAKAASPAASFRSVQQVNDGAQQGLVSRWL